MFYTKYLYNQNWNIGFTDDSIEFVFKRQALSKVKWMKHSYKDRFFADPFVLKTTSDLIIVLAEELIFSENKGRIVKLVVDKITKRLLERIVVLELDTHLSYPAIFRDGDLIYIYPENSASGELKIYSYDDANSNINLVKILIKEPLADSTIINWNEKYWIVATKAPNKQNKAYLYLSNSFDGEYIMFRQAPIVSDRGCARPAGDFIKYNNELYRPAQDCIYRYGSGIVMQKINVMSDNSYSEKTMFKIFPNSFKYNLGLHTINFYEGGCVIDGCGYLYPFMGRVLSKFSNIKNRLFNGI